MNVNKHEIGGETIFYTMWQTIKESIQQAAIKALGKGMIKKAGI